MCKKKDSLVKLKEIYRKVYGKYSLQKEHKKFFPSQKKIKNGEFLPKKLSMKKWFQLNFAWKIDKKKVYFEEKYLIKFIRKRSNSFFVCFVKILEIAFKEKRK